MSILTWKRFVVDVEVDKFDISSSKPSETGRVLSCFSIICQNFCIPESAFCARPPICLFLMGHVLFSTLSFRISLLLFNLIKLLSSNFVPDNVRSLSLPNKSSDTASSQLSHHSH